MAWFVYLLECRNGSVYTGITTDVQRRFAQHAAGKGARYTRSNPPLRVLGHFACPDRSSASRTECAIKRLPPAAKRALCKTWPSGCSPVHLHRTSGSVALVSGAAVSAMTAGSPESLNDEETNQ